MKSNDIILRKTFLATAVCMILESLAQSVGEMIDGIVIGRGLGHEAMAAFGICTPVITVCSVFGMVLAIGASTPIRVLATVSFSSCRFARSPAFLLAKKLIGRRSR